MDACITHGSWTDTPRELAYIQPSLADCIHTNKQSYIHKICNQNKIYSYFNQQLESIWPSPYMRASLSIMKTSELPT